MNERTIYLYKIVNPKGRIYIGQTVNPIEMFRKYKRNAIPSQHRLRESISKYGWYAHVTEIITTVAESSSDYAEQYLIAYYNSTAKGGLNILHGGKIKRTPEMNAHHSKVMTGKKHTDEWKAKASERLIGNQRAKGSIRSIEFRKNVSEKLKGFNRKGNPNYFGKKNRHGDRS